MKLILADRNKKIISYYLYLWPLNWNEKYNNKEHLSYLAMEAEKRPYVYHQTERVKEAISKRERLKDECHHQGKFWKDVRIEQNVSLQEIAQKMGPSYTTKTIRDWESGHCEISIIDTSRLLSSYGLYCESYTRNLLERQREQQTKDKVLKKNLEQIHFS